VPYTLVESNEKNFIDLCLAGDASPECISLFIREWHEKDSVMPLDDYLGMEAAEYDAWVENPKNLTHIIAARKNNIPISDYLQNVYDFSHRRDETDEKTEKE
jgi:hypothetical protein